MRLSRTWPFPLFPLSHPTPCYPRPSSGGPVCTSPATPTTSSACCKAVLRNSPPPPRSWQATTLDNTPTAVAEPECRCHHGGTPPYRPAPHLQGERQDPLRLRAQRPAPRGPAHGWTNTNASRPCSTRSINSRWLCSGPGLRLLKLKAWATAPPAGPSSRPSATSSPNSTPGSTVSPGHARPGGLHLLHTLSLAWWAGLALYLLQLGSRRQLDYDLRDGGPPVLANLNRLAETEQTTLPVHDTLDHFLLATCRARAGSSLRTQMAQAPPVAHEGPRCRPPAGPDPCS